MPIELVPLNTSVDCSWTIPGSKSLTNRALILAALADGNSMLEGVLRSDDTMHMQNALKMLGIEIKDIDDTTMLVSGGKQHLKPSGEDIFVGNSGTSVRFLAAFASLIQGRTTLVGDEHMAKRPIKDLCDALEQLSINTECPTQCPPIIVNGSGLNGGTVRIPGDKSSQYFSALMLIGGMSPQPIDIYIEGNLVSRPYVEMTIQMVKDFGGHIDDHGDHFTIHPCSSYRPLSYHIEPDASAASYAFALAAATQSSVKVPHLNGDSLQGDVAFVRVLEQMGALVELTPHYIKVTGPQQLDGIEIDMHHISDTVMTLAAIAPLCKEPVTIKNIANIRIKETDRLTATVNELKKLGQSVAFGDDWLRIVPQPIQAAHIECYADHRMAMSFAILGAAHAGVTIKDPDCVSKTYPGFWTDLKEIYSSINQQVSW